MLEYLNATFPQIQRITTYARSDTINRLQPERLKRYAELKLNRFHIGLETGNDEILKLMRKGTTKQAQIEAGIKAMAAGIEINEFYMPGMGGREYARQSALDTADVMNQVNPDFIRIRSMALAENLEMYEDYEKGILTRPNDIETIHEIRLFLENLHGINSWVDSDHILNILLELKGRLPQDKDNMLALIDYFLALPEDQQNIFRLGRRLGLMGELRDLKNHVLSFFFSSSASSLETPSLMALGAASTTALASARPRPVISRTALMTLIFSAPKLASTTSNSVFSAAASAAASGSGSNSNRAAAETPNSSSRA